MLELFGNRQFRNTITGSFAAKLCANEAACRSGSTTKYFVQLFRRMTCSEQFEWRWRV
jgi:hypothetical protein